MIDLWPCNIHDVWEMIEGRIGPWLDSVQGGEAALLAEVEEKRAFCWRSADAVLVLSLAPVPEGGLDMFVRAMVSIHPTTDAVDEHLPAVEKIARDLGAKRIRFRSMRRGWDRALGSRWRLSHVEYVTDVGT